MIELEDNEGNILIITTDLSGTDIFPDVFKSKLQEAFEKWGHFKVETSTPVTNDDVVQVTIENANPAKAIHYSDWILDFVDFAKETEVNFIVSWIPYVNAGNDAVSYSIQDGEVIGTARFSWGSFDE
jgi:hypothetical protein